MLSRPTASTGCTFPEYLQNDPDDAVNFWKYQYNADDRGTKVTFNNDVMSMEHTLLVTLGEKSVGRCENISQSGGVDYFLVNIRYADGCRCGNMYAPH